jgi:hypothetical protein
MQITNQPKAGNERGKEMLMKMKIGRKMAASLAGCVMALAIQHASANVIYTLGNANISGYTGPYATAEIDLTSSTTANITFTGLTSPVGGFLFGIGDTGFNVNGTGFSLSNVKEDGVSKADGLGSGNEDGFGSFNFIVNTSNSGSSSYIHMVTFTLTDSTANWLTASDVVTGNDKGNLVAAHLYVFNPDGSPANNTGFIDNSSVRQVPDSGATALLLGGALTGIGFMRRKLS